MIFVHREIFVHGKHRLENCFFILLLCKTNFMYFFIKKTMF